MAKITQNVVTNIYLFMNSITVVGKMTIKYIQGIHESKYNCIRHQGISLTDAFIANISTVT